MITTLKAGTFGDGAPYKVHVKYNFGDDLMIDNKPMSLIEGEVVYF